MWRALIESSVLIEESKAPNYNWQEIEKLLEIGNGISFCVSPSYLVFKPTASGAPRSGQFSF
jgi:hypothetical protein